PRTKCSYSGSGPWCDRTAPDPCAGRLDEKQTRDFIRIEVIGPNGQRNREPPNWPAEPHRTFGCVRWWTRARSPHVPLTNDCRFSLLRQKEIIASNRLGAS